MLLSWWWLGAVVALVAVLGGLHWTFLDLLMDLGKRRTDWWREGGSDPSDAPDMPPG
jgi:hypothetical protein